MPPQPAPPMPPAVQHYQAAAPYQPALQQPSPPAAASPGQGRPAEAAQEAQRPRVTFSAEQSRQMYEVEGLSLDAIAAQRGIKTSTVSKGWQQWDLSTLLTAVMCSLGGEHCVHHDDTLPGFLAHTLPCSPLPSRWLSTCWQPRLVAASTAGAAWRQRWGWAQRVARCWRRPRLRTPLQVRGGVRAMQATQWLSVLASWYAQPA